jgi:heme-degrading monooxygenase HmoA
MRTPDAVPRSHQIAASPDLQTKTIFTERQQHLKKWRCFMFARILEFGIRPEKKPDFIRVFKNEVLPILKKQVGFMEILPFFPEKAGEKTAFNISLWVTKADAERYEKEFYPKVYAILEPFLTTPVTVKFYTLETTLCERFVEVFAA